MAVTSTLALMAYCAEQEAHAQRQTAEREAKIARETTSFLLSLFQNADPFRTRGQSITARERPAPGLTRIYTAFPEAPEIRASLIGSMGEVYQGLGLYKTSAQLFDELEQSKLTANLESAAPAALSQFVCRNELQQRRLREGEGADVRR